VLVALWAVGAHALTALTDDDFTNTIAYCLAEDDTGVNCPVVAGTYGQMANWNTSLVTNMLEAFFNAAKFNADISAWDTSQVTTMFRMFNGASKFNRDIGSWTTSRVTSMETMFEQALVFNADISGWDTSQVTSMEYMFAGALAFGHDISGWPLIPSVSTTGMFTGAVTFQDGYNCEVEGGTADDGPPDKCIAMPCDASSAPDNGAAGDCTNNLAVGSTCQPSCDPGYVVSGATQCAAGAVITRAT